MDRKGAVIPSNKVDFVDQLYMKTLTNVIAVIYALSKQTSLQDVLLDHRRYIEVFPIISDERKGADVDNASASAGLIGEAKFQLVSDKNVISYLPVYGVVDLYALIPLSRGLYVYSDSCKRFSQRTAEIVVKSGKLEQ
jgi:hypothetical protein